MILTVINDIFFIHDYYYMRIFANTYKHKICMCNMLILIINFFKMILVICLHGSVLYQHGYKFYGNSLYFFWMHYIYALLFVGVYIFLWESKIIQLLFGC